MASNADAANGTTAGLGATVGGTGGIGAGAGPGVGKGSVVMDLDRRPSTMERHAPPTAGTDEC